MQTRRILGLLAVLVPLTNTRGDDVGAVYAVEDQLIAWGETL